MRKFKSRAGVEIEAYVVTDHEGVLQAPVGQGIDYLLPGDALITLPDGATVVRAGLFAALFEPVTADAPPDDAPPDDAPPDDAPPDDAPPAAEHN